ncbi:hypothetical protein MKS88_001949 [Plasmodium brasilianum]|uniref:Uncharacterized protein n=2 Tax=Plasmodium (Plasmodium) TaxID=418103 RepID=A0A1D3JMC9_PLAMA|nr:conserved Plasmodium protein, unknown function [Plasmodium malariae]KAI4839399.1 hypothetical protein MKS88_001949 [Plasmodium brasilianum]SBT87817.1 conserved Plasmodium protein, unknown function [Plasmodium malariae]
MDPYKFNSWIRILIALCSTGAYILISLMLPLFVAVPSFDAVYGIFFVAPYNDNKYITWYKFEDHICKNGKRYEDLSKTKHYEKNIRSKLCNSINFLKHYLLIAFIVALINLIVVKGTLIYAHFREHPETSSIKHVSFCNKIMALIVCLTLTNCALFIASFFFFNSEKEFGNSHYLHAGFYILLSDFVSHFLIIIFIKRDKTILKCVCELELLPWEQKPKLPVHNTQFNDTLISPHEITNYLHVLFQDDNLNEEKLKNFFGTSNYEEIYYIIMNNIKAKKEMMNTYP